MNRTGRSPTWRCIFGTAVGSAALLVLAGCGASPDAGIGTAVSSGAAGSGAVAGMTLIPAERRKAAPALSGPTLDGGRWSLADEKGSVVVLNVWASWCAPCRAEAPVLREVAAETAAAGVRFVGINIRDNNAAAIAFEARYGITYPSVADPASELLLQIKDLPPTAIPSTLLIDRQGKVAGRIIGPATISGLRQLVDSVTSPQPVG